MKDTFLWVCLRKDQPMLELTEYPFELNAAYGPRNTWLQQRNSTLSGPPKALVFAPARVINPTYGGLRPLGLPLLWVI